MFFFFFTFEVNLNVDLKENVRNQFVERGKGGEAADIYVFLKVNIIILYVRVTK